MRLKNYWRTLLNSLSSPAYYVEVLNTKFGFSLRFYFMSYLFLSIVSAVLFSMKDLPELRHNIDSAFDQLQQNYPAQLQLTWDKQTLHSTAPQPVEVPYPEFFHPEESPATLGYIDPTITDSNQLSERIPKSSVFVMGKDKVFLSSAENGWSEKALKDLPIFDEAFTITHDSLPDYLAPWHELFTLFLNWTPWMFGIAFFILMSPIRLLSIAFECLVIFLFLRLVRPIFPYRKILQIGLHVGVVAELVGVIARNMTNASTLWASTSLFSIAFWIYMVAILCTLRKVKSIPH